MPYKINKQSGNMDYVNASTGATLSSTQQQSPDPQQSGGFFRSAANTLIPRTSQLLKKAKAGISLSLLTDQEEEDREKRQKLIEQIIGRAKDEADPNRRSGLLAQARDLSKQGTDQIGSAISNFEAESGTKIGDKERVMAEALGVAGELGTWLLPAGKLAKVGKTGQLVSRAGQIAEATTATQRILKGAKLGGAIGVVSAATDPEKKTMGERAEDVLKEGGIGLIAGGATSAVFEGGLKAAKAFLGNEKSRKGMLTRLFRITPSKRRELRAATGGMDFEAEILARDAQDIAGMDYDQLVNHFVSRSDDAENALEVIIAGSDKTLDKQTLITILKKQASKLSPKKGNLGKSGAVNEIEKRIEELTAYEGDGIPLTIANNMKRDLQEAGAAAFSPNRKPTPTSNAMADASSIFKNAIEDAVGGKTVKDANRTIQLYQAAKRAIETTGDREAVKITNDLVQKFIQTIPATAAIAGGGIGFLAGGGVGAASGAALASILVSGGAGAARVKYLSPQIQTRMIARFSGLLEKQGVQNAGQMATEITQEMSKQIARYATLTPGTQDANQSIPGVTPEVSAQSSDVSGQVVGAVGQEQQGSVPQQLQGEPNQQAVQSPTQGGIDHAANGTQMVTIRNKKTGETKQVSQSELGQFGLAGDSADSIPGLPSKGEILGAMILDAQKGGKNISKLKTILDAYDQVEGDEEDEADKTKLTEKQKSFQNAGRAGQEALDLLESGVISTGFGGTVKGAIGERTGSLSDEQVAYRSNISFARTLVKNALLGGAITPTEEKNLKGAIPEFHDPPNIAKQKLKTFIEVAESFSSGDVAPALDINQLR